MMIGMVGDKMLGSSSMYIDEDVLIDEVIPKLENAVSKFEELITSLENIDYYLPDNFEYKSKFSAAITMLGNWSSEIDDDVIDNLNEITGLLIPVNQQDVLALGKGPLKLDKYKAEANEDVLPLIAFKETDLSSMTHDEAVNTVFSDPVFQGYVQYAVSKYKEKEKEYENNLASGTPQALREWEKYTESSFKFTYEDSSELGKAEKTVEASAIELFQKIQNGTATEEEIVAFGKIYNDYVEASGTYWNKYKDFRKTEIERFKNENTKVETTKSQRTKNNDKVAQYTEELAWFDVRDTYINSREPFMNEMNTDIKKGIFIPDLSTEEFESFFWETSNSAYVPNLWSLVFNERCSDEDMTLIYYVYSKYGIEAAEKLCGEMAQFVYNYHAQNIAYDYDSKSGLSKWCTGTVISIGASIEDLGDAGIGLVKMARGDSSYTFDGAYTMAFDNVMQIEDDEWLKFSYQTTRTVTTQVVAQGLGPAGLVFNIGLATGGTYVDKVNAGKDWGKATLSAGISGVAAGVTGALFDVATTKLGIIPAKLKNAFTIKPGENKTLAKSVLAFCVDLASEVAEEEIENIVVISGENALFGENRNYTFDEATNTLFVTVASTIILKGSGKVVGVANVNNNNNLAETPGVPVLDASSNKTVSNNLSGENEINSFEKPTVDLKNKTNNKKTYETPEISTEVVTSSEIMSSETVKTDDTKVDDANAVFNLKIGGKTISLTGTELAQMFNVNKNSPSAYKEAVAKALEKLSSTGDYVQAAKILENAGYETEAIKVLKSSIFDTTKAGDVNYESKVEEAIKLMLTGDYIKAARVLDQAGYRDTADAILKLRPSNIDDAQMLNYKAGTGDRVMPNINPADLLEAESLISTIESFDSECIVDFNFGISDVENLLTSAGYDINSGDGKIIYEQLSKYYQKFFAKTFSDSIWNSKVQVAKNFPDLEPWNIEHKLTVDKDGTLVMEFVANGKTIVTIDAIDFYENCTIEQYTDIKILFEHYQNEIKPSGLLKDPLKYFVGINEYTSGKEVVDNCTAEWLKKYESTFATNVKVNGKLCNYGFITTTDNLNNSNRTAAGRIIGYHNDNGSNTQWAMSLSSLQQKLTNKFTFQASDGSVKTVTKELLQSMSDEDVVRVCETLIAVPYGSYDSKNIQFVAGQKNIDRNNMTSNSMQGANEYYAYGGQTANGILEADIGAVDLKDSKVSKTGVDGIRQMFIDMFG